MNWFYIYSFVVFNKAFCASIMHYIAHMRSRFRLQIANCICVNIPLYISGHSREYLHYYTCWIVFRLFLHTSSIGRYNIWFPSTNVLNVCHALFLYYIFSGTIATIYKQPPFLFCAGSLLLPVRRFTPAMCADLGQMKLAQRLARSAYAGEASLVNWSNKPGYHRSSGAIGVMLGKWSSSLPETLCQ